MSISHETRATDPFFDGTARGELLLRHCLDCEALAWAVPPQAHCRRCLSLNFDWVKSAGTGKVWSAVRIHQRYSESVADRVPYPIGVVELDDGIRTPRVGLIVADDSVPAAGSCGRVTFELAPNGLHIPWFVIV